MLQLIAEHPNIVTILDQVGECVCLRPPSVGLVIVCGALGC